MKKAGITTRQRGLILLISAFHKIGLNPHNFEWAFRTGRLSTNLEWDIMKYVKANTLKNVELDADDAMNFLKEPYSMLKEKGWIKNIKLISTHKKELMRWIKK